MNGIKIKVGIAGAAGYTAGELLRILINHPEVELKWLHSTSQEGHPVSDTHTDLIGETSLVFDAEPQRGADVVFLCQGHGASTKYLQLYPWLLESRVIDLSNDFRLTGTAAKGPDGQLHPFVYGLTDWFQEEISKARHVANPGCFATAIQLALLPAAQAGMLDDRLPIHINAVTGSTGAGQSLSETSHFSWRQNNHSIYKAFNHQHEDEVNQSIKTVGGKSPELWFIPNRGAFTRGIFASVYFKTDASIQEVLGVYQAAYQHSPFVKIASQNPDLKQVVNTNKGVLYLEKHQDMLLVVSLIDNLLKGASGQAVENMNIMFGLAQDAGLKLKASNF